MVNFLLLGLLEILTLILGYGWGRQDERKAQKKKDKPHD